MEESPLNLVLFSSQNEWVEQNRVQQRPGQSVPNRSRSLSDASPEQLRAWAGSYYSSELDQSWRLEFADGGLWIVPPGEAAQLLSPNGPDGLRSRGVNVWFAKDAFLVCAVDEVTGDYVDGIWFEHAE